MSKGFAEQGLGKITEKQNLLTATKDMNLWRTTFVHVLKVIVKCQSWDDILQLQLLNVVKKKLVIGSVPARLEIGKVKSRHTSKEYASYKNSEEWFYVQQNMSETFNSRGKE